MEQTATQPRYNIRLGGLFYIAPESLTFSDGPLRRAIVASKPGDFVVVEGCVFGRRCDRAAVLSEKDARRFESRNTFGAIAERF